VDIGSLLRGGEVCRRATSQLLWREPVRTPPTAIWISAVQVYGGRFVVDASPRDDVRLPAASAFYATALAGHVPGIVDVA